MAFVIYRGKAQFCSVHRAKEVDGALNATATANLNGKINSYFVEPSLSPLDLLNNIGSVQKLTSLSQLLLCNRALRSWSVNCRNALMRAANHK